MLVLAICRRSPRTSRTSSSRWRRSRPRFSALCSEADRSRAAQAGCPIDRHLALAYVLEEFKLDETVILSRANDGVLKQAQIALPDSVKHKRYRQSFRTRFCEGLLSRRVLVAEGATRGELLSVAARRLSELNPGVPTLRSKRSASASSMRH